jgi:hypothetical protein
MSELYPARLEIDRSDTLDRLSSFFRMIWAIPILVIYSLLYATTTETIAVIDEAGETITWVKNTGGGILGGLFAATVLMILFRQKYPRWWFDFALELTRFAARIGAYMMLLTDRYPSTDESQTVHLDVEYPDVEQDLNRWLPLIKWFLAIPHYVVLGFLAIGVAFSVVIAWFAILFTGRYPQALFDFVVGVGRWALRVNAYMFLLVTDTYPPFRLQ